MSLLFQTPALSPSHRYLVAVLIRLRRFINRSVANMLANRERAATQFMLKKIGGRRLKDGGRFGSTLRGSPSLAAASASPGSADAIDAAPR